MYVHTLSWMQNGCSWSVIALNNHILTNYTDACEYFSPFLTRHHTLILIERAVPLFLGLESLPPIPSILYLWIWDTIFVAIATSVWPIEVHWTVSKVMKQIPIMQLSNLISMYKNTVKPSITDPLSSGHPPYSGHVADWNSIVVMVQGSGSFLIFFLDSGQVSKFSTFYYKTAS